MNQENAFVVAIFLYVLALIAWLAGKAFAGDQSIYVLAFDYLGVWIFSPLFVFIPWTLYNRSKAGMFGLIIPVVLFLYFYGSMFLPRTRPITDPQVSFSVMTFNLQCSNGEVNSILSIIDDYRPEVLALQEVTKRHESNLVVALKERYSYHFFYPSDGLAIFSLHPILNKEVIPAQPWSIQSAVIQVKGSPIHLLNGHLAKPGILQIFETRDINQARKLAAARTAQIEKIQQSVHQSGLPAIIACDGNMTDLTSSYALMTDQFKDAYREQGWGLGHTFLMPRGFEIRTGINIPFQRIDYLFYSPEIHISKVDVVKKDTGSDHRPLFAQFELTP